MAARVAAGTANSIDFVGRKGELQFHLSEPTVLPSMASKLVPSSSFKVESACHCFKLTLDVIKSQVNALTKALGHVTLPLVALCVMLKLVAFSVAPPPPPPPPFQSPFGHQPPPPNPLLSVLILLKLGVLLVATALVIPVCAHATAAHFLGEKAEVRGALKAARASWLRVIATALALVAVYLGIFLVTSFLAGCVSVLLVPHLITPRLSAPHLHSPAAEVVKGSARVLLALANEPPPLAAAIFTVIIVAIVFVIVVVLCIRYSFSELVAVMEPSYGFEALKRSATLTKSFGWRIFRFLVLCHLLSIAIVPLTSGQSMVDASFLKEGPRKWHLLPGIAALTLVTLMANFAWLAFVYTGLTVFYFGARDHHDGNTPTPINHDSLSTFVHGDPEKALYAPINPRAE